MAIVQATFRRSKDGQFEATDYHLTASTPATILDAVDCDGNTSDVDGNMRPQGGRCDLGADELKR